MNATFTGYKAKMNGQTVYVVNSGKLSDGRPGLKVRVGRVIGYAGWSGGANAQYAYGPAKWVAAESVK
jgi:hypothetical protein